MSALLRGYALCSAWADPSACDRARAGAEIIKSLVLKEKSIKKTKAVVPVAIESIERRILIIRGHKLLIDADLADLYGVETRVLNQAVKRNVERFPPDFMFMLSVQELDDWRSQVVMSNPGARTG